MQATKLLTKFVTLFLAVAVFFSIAFSQCSYAESSTDNALKPGKMYELITGNNPEYYSRISIHPHSIVIEGCYRSDPPVSVDLAVNGTISSTLKSYDEGKFSAVLNPEKAYKSVDSIIINLQSGLRLSYRIEYNNGWYFPDNRVSQQNTAVLDRVLDTAPKAWAGYISEDYEKESIEKTLLEIQHISDYIVKDMDGRSDYEKTYAIAKWVSDNIYYDRDARDSSVTEETISLKNVLATRKTVCSGYSNLFCALLEAQGIYAVNIRGTAAAGDVTYETLTDGRVNHEWTAVRLDDRWVVVDVVWNSNNKYVDGKFHKRESYDKYFDISELAMSFDHCAYLAEKRYFFKAPGYFVQMTATATKADAVPNLEQTESAADTEIPETETTSTVSEITQSAEESVTQEALNSSYSNSENGNEGTDIKLILVLILAVIIVIMIAIILVIKLKT